TFPSLSDPGLASDGRHVVHAWMQWVPDVPADGTWSELSRRLGELALGRIEEVAPGFRDRVVAIDVQTPADLERRFGLRGGCLYQTELALDQLLYMRPLPGWYDYATPVPGLYLCGACAHGGGGVTGLPGRNAAQRVLEDLARPGGRRARAAAASVRDRG
ncbi:MAG: amine oxidase, partial [Thermoanaerobaculia bacterium]|nr:amine oxidase [Thermoanaerobaculia bacterium]